MWFCIDRKNNKQTLMNTESYNSYLDIKHHQCNRNKQVLLSTNGATSFANLHI